MKIQIDENEYWWGLFADRGVEMPYHSETNVVIPMETCDQGAFLMVSSRGRYLYSEKQHEVRIGGGYIQWDGEDVELGTGHKNMRGAYMEIAQKYFGRDSGIPDKTFFAVPQYNTWIELMYNQNQRDIIRYAEEIIRNRMSPGVLMIDEGWSNDYGIFEFSRERFDDPKGMVDHLHRLGFTVMLWVVPLISPDSNVFRELRGTDILLRDENGEIAVRKWWNGYSAVLDVSNPKSLEWFSARLDECMEKYGVDGFKFDSGDSYLYRADDSSAKSAQPLDFTHFYNEIGKKYRYNEFRAAWNVKGAPYVCRLQDKNHSWGTDGLRAIIPDILLQGILGCFYGCPDMVGGGAYGSFLGDFQADGELYVRWLETSALMPMMQFSIAPWRILDEEHFQIVKEYSSLHEKYSGLFLNLAEQAALTKEPILRYMEYEFPGEGFEQINDQYMLGGNIMVAPVLEKDARERKVKLPIGRWRHGGRVYEGGKWFTLKAGIDELLVFEKIDASSSY